MQNYISSSTNPPRKRVARTIDGQIPPMLPWAAELLEKRLADAEHDKAFPNTASLCLPQGVPYMLHAAVGGPLQVLETPGQVTIVSDAYNEMWFIYLNRKHPPREDLEPSYHGDSVGHLEGETLVVDTIGLNTKTTLDQVGMPHSEDLRVVTRIRGQVADQHRHDEDGADGPEWPEYHSLTHLHLGFHAGWRASYTTRDRSRNIPLMRYRQMG